MRIPHIQMHRALSGLVVALALVVMPLPAFADDSAPTTQNNSTQQTTTTTAVTTPSEPAATTPPQPSIGSVTTDAATPVLQAVSETPNQLVSLPPATPTPSPTPATTPTSAASISHDINADATSGSAIVANNSQAGSATTGSAASTATILNVANANGLSANSFDTFECNVNGDVEQDLVIDPGSLLPICTTTTVGSNDQSSPNQSLQSGASLVDILNNIVLSANTGDATVDNNTEAGSATSGDATALANIVNIVNSSITAQNSFLGIINIYGSLKGNILVPQSLVDSLVGTSGASVIPAGTTTIDNNINATATTGEANVAGNVVGGSAATGDATTSLTVLNLTGQEVIAKNSLLVFVNVLGKWMGLIVPAAGSNTALLGGGVQNGSANGAIGATEQTGGSTVNIANNVNVNATTGNANVTGNIQAGDATSGNAKAGVNVLNVTNSNFLLDNWFGVLFINVLGSWLGDFNIQATALPAGTDENTEQPIQDVKVYQFEDSTTVEPVVSLDDSGQSNDRNGTDITPVSTPTGTVLGASETRQQKVDGDQAVKAVKLDLFALVAIIVAFTLLIATGTMILRRWHDA
jgi:hypothetical protein